MKKIIIILILTIGLNIINVNAENIAINEEVGTIKEELENPQTGESAPLSLLPIGIIGVSILIILRKINNLYKI